MLKASSDFERQRRGRWSPAIVGLSFVLCGSAFGEEELVLPSAQPAQPARDGSQNASTQAACGGFPCSGVRLLSWLDLAAFSTSSVNDCWGYTSPSGREYAVLGLRAGTAFIDITVPSGPQILASFSGPSTSARDVKVVGHYAYAAGEGGGGVQVFDLGQIDSGIVTNKGSVTTGGTSATHNLAIDEVSGFLYRCRGGSNGLRVYDLNVDPVNPPFVGSWSQQPIHDAQVVTYTSGAFAGRQIAYCPTSFNASMVVVDVTDKSNMTALSEATWPNAQHGHQVWLSEDLNWAYVNDEFDEPPLTTTTYVMDVSDPANISYLTSFTNGNPAVGHNAYVKGNLIYQANYRSGLRVFDATNPTAPVESAWFDTYPLSDSANFNGLWSCYPYFPSGVVIGSDTDRGLFVWWVGQAQLSFSFPQGLPANVHASGGALAVQIQANGSAVLKAGTEMLHYDSGAGFVATALQDLGGGLYQALLPPLSCNQAVDYYFSAETTGNITWTSPDDAPAAPWTTTATCPPGPSTYCGAKLNSCGTLPSIASSGTPSASAGSGFQVSASNTKALKFGLLLYTDSGPANSPFSGGVLCLGSAPLRRSVAIADSVGTPGQCDGVLAIDMNAFASGALGGIPLASLLVQGTQVNAQFWARDTTSNGALLSDAIEYSVGP